jgi:hypothetical protein
VRPSELLDIQDDPFAAFCLDRACFNFGAAIEGEIHHIEGKNQKEVDVKVERLLRKWLDLPAQYRDPATSGDVQLPTKGEVNGV